MDKFYQIVRRAFLNILLNLMLLVSSEKTDFVYEWFSGIVNSGGFRGFLEE